MVHHSIKTQFCLSDSSSTEAIERRIYPKCKVLCHNEIICRRHLCSNLHVLTLSKYRVILTRPSYFTGFLKYVPSVKSLLFRWVVLLVLDALKIRIQPKLSMLCCVLRCKKLIWGNSLPIETIIKFHTKWVRCQKYPKLTNLKFLSTIWTLHTMCDCVSTMHK